jgi:iron(III) transport system ATP-binding protein
VARLTLSALTKSFGSHRVLNAVSMVAEAGEFIAILGPSGCGKTTLLRLLAGFEKPDSGTIALGERLLAAPGIHVLPEERRMGIVFQSYALWPHLDVGENVGYALRVQKVPAAEREARILSALETVGLAGFRHRRPASLSGGQRQRVALARCLAMEPALVLLDEPLANLDVHLRATMEEEFARFHRQSGRTMVYITHDQAEAMALADRIAVMDRGEILQFAAPSTLYREPVNEIVARFIGEGMVVSGPIIARPNATTAIVELFGARARVRCQPDAPASGQAMICLRRQDLVLADKVEAGFAARIRRLTYQGGHFHADLVVERDENVQLGIALPEPTDFAPGDLVPLSIRDGWVLPQAAKGA